MGTRWIDSVPAWALGPRPSNAKFGGGIILAGIPDVYDRLVAIKRLSRKMGLKGEDALRSSGHILHEVRTSVRKWKKHNADTAIEFRDLMSGIRNEVFPFWVAMTAPQFGFKGAERGGMISRIPADRQMAKDLHLEAIARSMELENSGFGAGINIWWPAWTSRKIDEIENPPMEFQEAWDTMLAFWVDVLRTSGGKMWLEWKPGDPGIDYLMTLELAIKFCMAVNKEFSTPRMFINNEFAHVLLSGLTVSEGVQMTVEARLFDKFVHANSGQQFPLRIQTLLEKGIEPDQILIGSDWDWVVGAGGDDNWRDQQKSIGIMDKAGQDVIYCEHDVNPAGQDPLKIFELSIRNRQEMLSATRAS
jgi:hypothetical protein